MCKEEFQMNSAFSFLNMPCLTVQQRVWVCLEYAMVNNAEEVIRRWPIHWGNVPSPSKHTVIKTFRKFVREGTCHNLKDEAVEQGRRERQKILNWFDSPLRKTANDLRGVMGWG